MMWFAWTFFGLAQIWTGRYLVHWWRWRQFTHSVLGSFIGVLTTSSAIVIFTWEGWTFAFDDWHCGAGLISVGFGTLLVLGGIFA